MTPTRTPRTSRGIVLVVAATILVALIAGCSAADDRHPAVVAMQEVLELRRDSVADAEKYTPYFVDPDVAATLAESSEATAPPIPLWEEPYLSAETTSSADVVVVWKADDEHPDWPEATVFVFEVSDGTWRIADALDVGDELPEPLDTVDE